MTSPQHPSLTTDSTEPTRSAAQNIDAAESGSDTSSGTTPTRSVTENVHASETPGQSRDTGYATERSEASTASAGAAPNSSAMSDSSAMSAESSAQRTGTSQDETLFGERELSTLRSRWADVQAGFVDDPRESVQKADRLVADLVQQLTAGFAEARSRLEGQWARGEEVTTENLRVALRRYRDFFERLLAV